MDFEFLYDTSRDLLTIGYDAGERRRDPSCYDLLASEARLTSFLLIAQGKIPQKHWFSLGRLLTSHGRNVSLISWSGSMFEYLMPALVTRSFEGSLLHEACAAAVRSQIAFGGRRGRAGTDRRQAPPVETRLGEPDVDVGVIGRGSAG